jgi:putative BNR repeat neuraminidase
MRAALPITLALALAAATAAGCGYPTPGVCDGTIDRGEECDDGNDDPADGCDCQRIVAWVAPIGSDRRERGALLPPAPLPAEPIVLDEDGGWCWFSDERVVFLGDRVYASSVSHAGDIQVASYDLASGARQHAVLRRRLERDDHDVASLVPLADGRLLAFYTRHDGFSTMWWRWSEPDGDISTWDGEEHFSLGEDVCYSNPFVLSGEGDGPDPRLYLFFRGRNYNPTYAISDDDGLGFSEASQLLDAHSTGLLGRTDQRPYVKYVSDGVDTIHLFYTDGHPAEASNSLHHLYYRDGLLHHSDGSVAAPMNGDVEPRLSPGSGTRIHDGGGPEGEAWVWDAALDGDGRPVVVYATYPERGREGEAQDYRYARWDGAAWRTSFVAHGGTGIYAEERFYGGGIAIDPDDPDVLYLSSNVDPETGIASRSGRFEIYRAVTADGGATWQIEAVTAGSRVDNLRPTVPAGHPTPTAVVWMQGVYQSYYDYDTRIVGLFGAAGLRAIPPASDLAQGQPTGLEPVARFDLGGALSPIAGGYVAARELLGRVMAEAPGPAGPVTLELWNLSGSRDSGRGTTLENGVVYREAGGYGSDDKLHLRLTGLAPGAPYALRMHGYQPFDDYLSATLWFRAGGDDSLLIDGNPRFLGGHRHANGWSGGDGALLLQVEADGDGAIELVARGLGDRGDHETAVLGAIEVLPRPATAAVAVTVRVLGDRLVPDESPELVVGDDWLTVDVEGLEVGALYEVTVRSTDVADNLYEASRWRVEQEGLQPIVVRGFQLNNRSDGPAGSFTFYHRAARGAFRLRGQDVLYTLSTDPSLVLFNGIEVRKVTP